MDVHLVALAACAVLVAIGAAIQVAVGAGLSVVCGSFVLLWLGAKAGVPLLLGLNLLLSIVAAALGTAGVRWSDAALASAATVAGCAAAAALPSFPDPVLRGLTAAVLVVVALPRPAGRGAVSVGAARVGIGVASLVTGLLTVWTATPGPLTPVAMARAGRSGDDIRRTMQPISVIGYGAALGLAGWPASGAPETMLCAVLAVATLVGTGAGFRLRRSLEPARVVQLIRLIAAVAAALLLLSLFR